MRPMPLLPQAFVTHCSESNTEYGKVEIDLRIVLRDPYEAKALSLWIEEELRGSCSRRSAPINEALTTRDKLNEASKMLEPPKIIDPPKYKDVDEFRIWTEGDDFYL